MSKGSGPGASNALGLLRIETRRGVTLQLSPFILAAAWWMAWYGAYGSMFENLTTGVYIWEETSRTVKDSILTTGPLAAGFSAWMAGRERRRGMVDLLSTTACPTAARALLAWLGAALPFAGVYVLLSLSLGVPTVLNVTWGTPLVGYFLVGFVALLMDSALGFAAGHWLPGRFTAPLSAVAIYIAHLLPMGAMDYEKGVALLSPAAYSNLSGVDVFHEAQGLATQQILLFGGLGGMALAAVALKAGARRTSRVALFAFSAVAVVGLVAALNTENEYAAFAEPSAVPFDPVCEGGEITVCVHPAYEKLLPQTARTVNEVAEPIADIPGAPTHAMQIDNYGNLPPDFEPDRTATFSYAGEMSGDEVAYSLVTDEAAMPDLPLSADETEVTEKDLQRCGGSPDKRYFYPAFEAQSIVGDWLLLRSGRDLFMGSMAECPNADPLRERFDALGPTARRAWFEKNLAGLRAGEVTLEDLP